MPFLIIEMTTFVEFDLISYYDIRVLKQDWKDGVAAEHLILFNKDLMSIFKLKRELYRVSVSSHQKGVVIMLIIGIFMSTNE